MTEINACIVTKSELNAMLAPHTDICMFIDYYGEWGLKWGFEDERRAGRKYAYILREVYAVLREHHNINAKEILYDFAADLVVIIYH